MFGIIFQIYVPIVATIDFKDLSNTKQDEKKIWIKVFHHNIEGGYFSSNEDAMSSTAAGKYSKLSSISNLMKIDGYFEFRLEYPNEGLVYHWQQSENPILTAEGSLGKDNYSQIINPNPSKGWRGYLALSSLSTCTYLDGYASNDWWFSIGAIKCSGNNFYKDHPNKIPGPLSTGVTEVVLWIRVPDNLYKKIFHQIGVLTCVLSLF